MSRVLARPPSQRPQFRADEPVQRHLGFGRLDCEPPMQVWRDAHTELPRYGCSAIGMGIGFFARRMSVTTPRTSRTMPARAWAYDLGCFLVEGGNLVVAEHHRVSLCEEIPKPLLNLCEDFVNDDVRLLVFGGGQSEIHLTAVRRSTRS